jgi:Rrf2 family cysteine metabolism transcriptional repressor
LKLSTRGNYGVRAIYELARNYGKGPIQIKQISERQEIPLRYLEQLLLRLKKSGIIESIRGPSGGYVLTDDPSNLSIGMVFRVLEGPFQMSGCVQSGNKDHCKRMNNCISNILWSQIEKRFEQLLEEISLFDLIQLKCDFVCEKVLKQ